jgi:hypothetical protein
MLLEFLSVLQLLLLLLLLLLLRRNKQPMIWAILSRVPRGKPEISWLRLAGGPKGSRTSR